MEIVGFVCGAVNFVLAFGLLLSLGLVQMHFEGTVYSPNLMVSIKELLRTIMFGVDNEMDFGGLSEYVNRK